MSAVHGPTPCNPVSAAWAASASMSESAARSISPLAIALPRLPRAAILAGKPVAQEHVEPGEGGLGGGPNEGLERDDAGELHFSARAVHRAVVVRDGIHPIEKD